MSQSLTPEDRCAIEDLMARYAWSLDTGDVDAFVDCFATDGAMVEEVFGEPAAWEGTAAIRRLAQSYREIPDFAGRQHHGANLQVTAFTEGRVHARSFVFVTECRGDPPHALRFCGWFDDELVRIDDRWVFARRTLRQWGGDVLHRFPTRPTEGRLPSAHLRIVDR
jgi:hypothetical protein